MQRRRWSLRDRLVRGWFLVAAFACLGSAWLWGQGITIEDSDWENFTMASERPPDAKQLCADRVTPGAPYSFVCQTADGVPFMALAGRCPTITYTLEVSSLPEGKTRFPIALSMRMIANPSGAQINIHNETTASYITMGLPFRAGVQSARDDTGTSEQVAFNPQEALPQGDLYDSTDPADIPGRAPSTIGTQAVTLALVLGKNVIRFDACVPDADGDHGQFFQLAIGAGEAGLVGAVVTGCSVFRAITPQTYTPGGQVTVKLAATTVPAGTTIVEEFPAGMSVANAGGGTVGAGTITFSPPSGSPDIAYVLDTAQVCGVSTFNGAYTSPAACEGAVVGASKVRCVGAAGIRLQDDDFSNTFFSDPPIEADPCAGQIQICTTLDGAGYLYPTALGVRLFRVGYLLTVDALPSGLDTARVTVALKARRISGTSGVFGIRNATNGSWIGFTIAPSVCVAGCDLGEGDQDLSNVSKATMATDATDPAQGGVAPDFIVSEKATIALDLGVNEISIENFGPGGLGTDDGDIAQVFVIAFGPGEEELQGRLCGENLPYAVERTIDPRLVQGGQTVSITLTASEVTQPITVVETYPAEYTVVDAGGGTVDAVNTTITFTFAANGSKTYKLQVPAGCPACSAPLTGVVSAGGQCTKRVLGPSAVECDLDAPTCPAQQTPKYVLEMAFAFGVHAPLGVDWGSSPNDPAVPFTKVEQIDVASLQYDAGRGWGYEALYAAGASPYGDLGGYEIFGPMDNSPNNRAYFPTDTLPEEIYDSLIGCKNFLTMCGTAETAPCDPPEGIIFRADVPNGKYRFVAAIGDCENNHAHRILAENGGSGPPENIGAQHVVLASNYDQAAHLKGEVNTTGERGAGVFGRVGFDDKIPPLGDGAPPDPQFINLDENGNETSGCATSPTLTVTEGSIRIHQLQGRGVDGCGGVSDPMGGDLVVLELWRMEEGPTGVGVFTGNANGDGTVNIADAVTILGYLFGKPPKPAIPCFKTADSNDDDTINVADAIDVLSFLFGATSNPSKPMTGPDGSAISTAACRVYPAGDIPAQILGQPGCATPCTP